MKLVKLIKTCKRSDSSFVYVLFLHIFYKLRGKNILAHQKTIIKGLKNIETKNLLQIGISYFGFIHKKDVTFLNINGKFIIDGPFSIGRGCRIDIGKRATVRVGAGSYINPFTQLIINHDLEIGNNCSVSWECQFLDDDFHQLRYEGQKELSSSKITISDHVWIGSRVSIYKGSFIAKGCVVASNSVIKGIFNEENTLIGGNPARILKRNIIWE